METSGCAPEEDLCQAFSDVLLNIKDVDADDAENPMLCSEYVKDIYNYLRQVEVEQAVRPKYLQGQEVTGNMRAILIDWLVQVQMKFKLLQETMYMTVGIIDRFLQANPVPKKMLQLVGVTAMLLASKYEEMYPPEIADFAFVTDHTYTTAQIRAMEMKILRVLHFGFGRPIPLQFLRRASKIGEVTAEQHTLAKYLMELTMVDYEMVHYPPSQIAAAALALTLNILNCGEWTPTLQHHMNYTESCLVPVMQHMAKNVVRVNEGLSKHMNSQLNAENRTALAVASKPGLRPRAVLRELENNRVVTAPALVKETSSILHVFKPVTNKMVLRKSSMIEYAPGVQVPKRTAAKQTSEECLQIQHSSPMETSGCAPEDDLCQAFSDVLLNIKDVDSDDAEDPMLCSQYVKDIYNYLGQLEVVQAVRPKFLEGQEVTGNMRAILIDWLVQVQMKFRLLQETMYMTVGIIDRFLQVNPVPKKMLQLVGVTAMFLASKYEEIYPPEIADFAFITDHSCSTVQIRAIEMKILSVLQFSFGCPIALQFLWRASKIGEANAEQHTLAKYLMELTMVDYDMVHYPPSQIAAAAFALALKVLDFGEWTPTLQHYMNYTECSLIPVMQHIAKNVVKVNEGLTKYMNSQLNAENRTALAGKGVVASKPGLRPRAVLGDLGNKGPVTKPVLKKDVRPAATKAVQKKTNKSENAPEPLVPKRTEAKQTTEACAKVQPPSPTPMEISGCAPEEDLCQAFSDVLLNIKDVDSDDAENPMLCSEYVKDIYNYLGQLEVEQAVRPKYLQGQEVTGNMRTILIDWLVQVQLKFQLLQETMYMTVGIIDRFLQLEDSPELKVVKLLEVVKHAELPVFDSFCVVLGEMGFWYLAQTLQAATKEKDASSSPGKVSDGNNVLKEVLLLPKDDSAVKEDNVRLRRKVQYLKNEYTKRLKDLEEDLALVREERDAAMRQRGETRQQNEELRALNTEMRALITKLHISDPERTTVKDVGHSMDLHPTPITRYHRKTKLGFFFG
ncbi:UNVERIFIED_CONTAM: hypothetical protein FKN15_058889 [Acipenser sinensis]